MNPLIYALMGVSPPEPPDTPPPVPSTCDRCGDPGTVTEWQAVRATHDQPVGQVALCGECTGGFLAWLEQKKLRDSNPSAILAEGFGIIADKG